MPLMTDQHQQQKRPSRPRSAACSGLPHERSLLVWDERFAVGAQRRALTSDGAEGTSTTDARPSIFNAFTHSNRRVYTEFSQVLAVGRSFHAFTIGNRRFLHSSHSGVTCSSLIRCRAPQVFPRTRHSSRSEPQTQQGRPEERPGSAWLLEHHFLYWAMYRS